MESEEIIRAYLLEPGDVFKMGGNKYRVTKIENGQIYYYLSKPDGGGNLQTMGANSQEKLSLITNKNKQNEHQN